jgi:hypothetical protein
MWTLHTFMGATAERGCVKVIIVGLFGLTEMPKSY